MSLATVVVTALLLSVQPIPQVSRPVATKRVLVVLSAVDRLPNASSATGNYLREVAYPVIKLTEAGAVIEFVTPDGSRGLVRGNEAYGLSPDADRDPVLRTFVEQYLAEDGRIRQVRRPSDVRASDYVGVFYVGSLGALIDVATDVRIAEVAGEIHERGGFVAASGHGIAGLLALRTKAGQPLLRQHRVAPFTRDEDIAFFHERLGWRDVLPYHVEDRIRDTGAIVEKKEKFSVNVVEDDRMITAQNAGSVHRLTEVLVGLLER